VRSDDIDKLETSGYVLHSLQTALHDALTSDNAEEAIVTAINRGGDTDTIGAIAGAVAGARFGADSLPDR
jgi:ADP-ribosyl-[dinitrogen reductase] hydrolase